MKYDCIYAVMSLLRPDLIAALGVTFHLLEVQGTCKDRWSINDLRFPIMGLLLQAFI